jgi:hypothetical protein
MVCGRQLINKVIYMEALEQLNDYLRKMYLDICIKDVYIKMLTNNELTNYRGE